MIYEIKYGQILQVCSQKPSMSSQVHHGGQRIYCCTSSHARKFIFGMNSHINPPRIQFGTLNLFQVRHIGQEVLNAFFASNLKICIELDNHIPKLSMTSRMTSYFQVLSQEQQLL